MQNTPSGSWIAVTLALLGGMALGAALATKQGSRTPHPLAAEIPSLDQVGELPVEDEDSAVFEGQAIICADDLVFFRWRQVGNQHWRLLQNGRLQPKVATSALVYPATDLNGSKSPLRTRSFDRLPSASWPDLRIQFDPCELIRGDDLLVRVQMSDPERKATIFYAQTGAAGYWNRLERDTLVLRDLSAGDLELRVQARDVLGKRLGDITARVAVSPRIEFFGSSQSKPSRVVIGETLPMATYGHSQPAWTYDSNCGIVTVQRSSPAPSSRGTVTIHRTSTAR